MNAEVNESLQSSALAQRLSRRVVDSPGVINLRQLPTQRTQSAANTIIQRYALSDRIESRYNTAPIFQPTGIAHLFQRSRTEAFSTLDTPLSSPSVRGNGEWAMGNRNWESSPPRPTFSASSVPSVPPVVSSTTFRVSRRLSPETTQSNFEPSLTQTSSGSLSTQNPGDISSSDRLAAPPPAPESPSERVRVRHPSRSNTSIQRVPISQSDRADTAMGTSDNSIESQGSLDLPLQRVSLPNSDRADTAMGTSDNSSPSHSSLDLPLQKVSLPNSDRADTAMGTSDNSSPSHSSLDLPLQKVSLPNSDRADTAIGTSDNSSPSHSSLDLPLQRVSLPNSDRPTHPNAKAVSPELTSPATSFGNFVNEATATSPVTLIHRHSESASVMRVARKRDLKASPDSPIADVSLPSIPANLENVASGQTLAPTPLDAMPHVVARVSLAQDTEKPSDTLEQKRSPLPMRLSTTASHPSLVQRQPQKGSLNAAESNNHPPKVSATISASGTPTTRPEMVWRNPTAESAPPLSPIRETSNSSAIARQTLSESSPASEPVSTASSTSATPTAEPTPTTATNNIDIQQIAQQVSRILKNQLTVERERRGIGKW